MADTLTKLKDDYGTDARDEVFKALRKGLEHTPLWMLLRHGLKVRGLELRLYYPQPRSAESAAAMKHGENRITFRISAQFAAKAGIGRKYLVNHSAGSGKTLTICWLADRLHSLFKPARAKSWSTWCSS